MQILVEIGPSNASQGQRRLKVATEQMKNLTLARTRTQVPGFYSADALTTKLRLPVAYIYIYIYIYIYMAYIYIYVCVCVRVLKSKTIQLSLS